MTTNTPNTNRTGQEPAATAGQQRPEEYRTVNSISPIISARNINKNYGINRVLKEVNLDIFPGESVAIMGPSGSGKTTLLHVLSGIITADSGTVQLAETTGTVELSGASEKQRTKLRASTFGFIFQQGLLVPELTAEENVSLAAMLAGISRKNAQHASVDLLTRLGLGQFINHRIGELSGGQAQRVAIARSQVAGASITFADEPTGALDSTTAREVMSLLLTMIPQEGKTLIIVTHDPIIARQCSRIIELHDGQITRDSNTPVPENTAPAQLGATVHPRQQSSGMLLPRQNQHARER